jgi:hypothetical protein
VNKICRSDVASPDLTGSPSIVNLPRPGDFWLIDFISVFSSIPLKKRCRILPAGGLIVSPNFKKSPKIGG